MSFLDQPEEPGRIRNVSSSLASLSGDQTPVFFSITYNRDKSLSLGCMHSFSGSRHNMSQSSQPVPCRDAQTEAHSIPKA